MLKLGLITGALITLLASLAGCVPPQQQQAQGFDWTVIVFLVLIFAVFYFMMIRPQRKRQKEHQSMMNELKKGDQVITAGGIFGQIDGMDEESILLKVESGALIRVSRSAVVGVRQK